MTKNLVIGGGPAGLTAALELCKLGQPTRVLEASQELGGISRTCQYKGYRFDIGGHRFFTKVKEVDELWTEILESELLERPRLSRIYYGGKLFDYPLKPLNALAGLGPIEAVRIVASYAKARCLPIREEKNFEEWVVNRFGKRLYEIFFKTYTEKVWGIPGTEISSEWAAQRIKNLSLSAAIKDALGGAGKKKGEIITTLIDRFRYPRLGPGQMWEACASMIEERGGEVDMGSPVTRVRHDGKRVTAVTVTTADGETVEHDVQSVLSSMPLRELVECLDPAPPAEVLEAARSLSYRDFLTVVLIVDREEVFPDNWIYIHSPDVEVGRVQNYKNWSPYMVPDSSKTSLGLEYFVDEGDRLWSMPDEELIKLATDEVDKLKLVDRKHVVDGMALRVKKAYPIYDDAYKQAIEGVRAWMDRLENLIPIGRNGQHRYNNQDHSMMTGLLAARNLAGATHDVWDVNVEQEYHEEGSDEGSTAGSSMERMVPRRAATESS